MSLPTPARLIADAVARLAAFPNPQLDAETLFRGVSGFDRASLLARLDEPVEPGVAARFAAAVARRANHEPIQYILGIAAFWRDEFIVTPAVLIPRPDTEILIEAVAARLRPLAAPRLLDVGTGSGCIALSLLRELPGARAVAVDLSGGALEIAGRNAAQLGLRSRIDLRISRWFEALDATEVFDAVVSNPPYVARGDEPSLPIEVREHEPALALFAEPGDDLSSYREILGGLGNHLGADGLLALEVGAGQADRVAELLSDAGLRSIEILNDLARIPRVAIARR
jgi:release factor glutamine methyltransferase